MAIVKGNIATEGLSGMIGRALVYRQLGGRTVVSAAPTPPGGPGSAGQQQNRSRFREASRYATAQKHHPDLYAAYQAAAKPRHLSAYNIALADYLNSPVIHKVALKAPESRTGMQVSIFASDDFKVSKVQVSIFMPNGMLAETGFAQPAADADAWHYTLAAADYPVSGLRLRVEAHDYPGNTTVWEQAL